MCSGFDLVHSYLVCSRFVYELLSHVRWVCLWALVLCAPGLFVGFCLICLRFVSYNIVCFASVYAFDLCEDGGGVVNNAFFLKLHYYSFL